MAEVIAPPVHVLDFGYQAPNPIDYTRAASMAMSPITEAVQRGNEAKNAFMLQQLNADKALELAKAQHQMQMQRSKMMYDRAVDVQNLKNAAVQAAGAQKYRMLAIAQQAQKVADLGGDPSVDPSDPNAFQILQDRYNERVKSKPVEDAHAIARNQLRNQQIQEQMALPPKTAAIEAKAQSDIMASAQMKALNKMGMTLDQVKADPQALAQFKSEMAGEVANESLAWQAKNPALAQQISNERARYASMQKEMEANDAQIKSLGTIQGANGRTVPNPFYSQSLNLANDVISGKAMHTDGKTPLRDVWFPGLSQSQKAAADSTATAKPASQPNSQGNPIVPPQVQPMAGFDAAGNPINTAPLAEFGRDLRDATYFFDRAGSVPIGANFTPQDRAVAAQIPGFWAGAAHGLNPMTWARGVGGLFDSTIDNSAGTNPDMLRFSPIGLPAPRVAPVSVQPANNIVAPPQVVAPPAPPQSGFQAYQIPQYAPPVSPNAALFDPSLIVQRAQALTDDASGRYSGLESQLQQQAYMSQMYPQSF
jgi:hypothetical protein